MLAVADQGFGLVVDMHWVDMRAGRLVPYKNVGAMLLDEGHFLLLDVRRWEEN